MEKKIAILWRTGPGQGSIEVTRGTLLGGYFENGEGHFAEEGFSCNSKVSCRLVLNIKGENLGPGAHPTIVSVRTTDNPFSFFLRDVDKEFPILIPVYNVAVIAGSDIRSYDEIEAGVQRRGLVTNLERIDIEPEESFEEAARHTRAITRSIILGISRDIRIFELELDGTLRY